ncbi:hypothetical protein Hanom_Chr02g00125921 [Helianthus anomalus]
MVTACHDGYAEGYTGCSQHVTSSMKFNWETSRSATDGVDTSAAHAAAKDEYNNLRLPVIDLVTSALQHENYVDQLKEVFRMKRRLQIMKT